MNKYFATILVTASALLAATSGSAMANCPHRPFRPAKARNTAPAWVEEVGTASYYGPRHHGHRAASGVRFDQRALTAAHPWLPFGTKVLVTLAGTNRSVIVTITDRLYSDSRIVDLSLAAARQLGMVRMGIARVTLLPA